MDPDLLRDHLSKLHEELGAAERVDPRAAALLVEIMNDIKRLTGRSGEATNDGQSSVSAYAAAPAATPEPAAADPPASLPGRLEKIAVEFEAQHPTLAASSRRLVDLLAKAGL